VSDPSTEEVLIRFKVAEKLEELATQVRAGHFKSLRFDWKGGTEIDLKLGLQQPLEFVSLEFVVDGRNESPK